MNLASKLAILSLWFWSNEMSRSVVSGFTPISSHEFRYEKSTSSVKEYTVSTKLPTTTALRYTSSSSQDDAPIVLGDNVINVDVTFSSPILRKLYPKLIEWKELYGHPNIPLGTSEGGQCRTIRRLQTQNKLTSDELAFLDSLGFTFHSMEDVYKYADFDDLFDRLMMYTKAHPECKFQVPKKCPEDPELGAWVTGIRRLGTQGVRPEHRKILDSAEFVWKSKSKCGSNFMLQYREIARLVNIEGIERVLEDPKTMKWLEVQQGTFKRGDMSQTRVHYMEQVFGDTW